MKKFLALILFFSLFSLVTAFIDENRTEFLKGETIHFSGLCPEGATEVSLSAAAQEKKIFSFDLNCLEGKFSFDYNISFLDPEGEWTLALDSEERKLTVSPSRESQYLVIRFLSPTLTLERTQDINIIVEITDKGLPLLDGNVVSWDIQGNKLRLAHKGQGAYIVSTQIPFDAPLGAWNLVVTAEKLGDSAGGESRQKVNVKEASILIEFIEPQVSVFGLDGEILVKVRAAYLNGEPLKDPAVTLYVDGESHGLKEAEESYYSTVYLPKEGVVGAQVLTVRVLDSALNEEANSKEIVLVKDFSWYIKRYYWLPLLVIGVFVAFYLVTKSALRRRLETKNLKSRQKALEQRIKSLQEKYFSGVMAKTAYRQELSKLEKELSEVKQELRLRQRGQKTLKKKKRKQYG